jgi:DNA-directed RNA polymerase specialized sigma24 family protein
LAGGAVRQEQYLKKVAFRMPGSASKADDAIQEAWLRLSRPNARVIDSLTSWLTMVVARICLDVLRLRKARREELLDMAGDFRRGPALFVVLGMLTPRARRFCIAQHVRCIRSKRLR